MHYTLLICSLAFILVSCSSSPELLATLPPPPTSSPLELPSYSGKPQAAKGAALFAELCAACHGEEGAGDGPLALEQQIPPPGNFRLGEQSWQSPQEWFDTITDGRLERLMPPWNSLSAADCWQLTWFSYTLAYSEEESIRGKALWADHCALCHLDGEQGGKATSAQLGPNAPAMGDLDRFRLWSDEQIDAAFLNGTW